ncbi:U3 small nucleolar RNA-associated protein 18 homolog [Lepisosteus oculatus]|nr:PREDICTED: U3 small nucleolar RNA-associated protein 18 homolog [Lepisosteus oculatus]XP_015212098.1 PREDICTED: U3 small nucleolar RNA-associated protein 18 homolog [Lepisosteus oculatus]
MDKNNRKCEASQRKSRKRAAVSDGQLEAEEIKRQIHLSKVTALGEKEESERLLEDLVFGAEDELVERLIGAPEDEGAPSGNLLDESSSDSEVENESRLQVERTKKAAWLDEDDNLEEDVDMTHRFRKDFLKSDIEKKLPKQMVQQRLREQFQRAMGGTPSWAEKGVKKKNRRKGQKGDSDDDDDDEEDSLLKKTGNFVAASESLPKGIIQMKNCLNANNDRPSDTKLTTVQFHPSAQVVMTAGMDQSVSLFQVDGKTNPKIQSIFLERFPVHKARFSADGEQVIATGTRNRLFYVYDMIEGKIIPVHGVRALNESQVKEFEVSPDGSFLLLSGTSGYLHLLTLKTKELVRSMKINGKVTGATFSSDGSKIYACSDEGEVYIWDVKSSKWMNRFTDEGCLKGTSIAVSRNGQYLACGSNSGVVNIYSHDACLQESTPKPLKAIMNLVTSASSLLFNPTTEILAMASNVVDEAVKLVHIPSFSVFSNFPVFRRKTIFLPQCMDFSPRSGFFSVANNKGKALLYRLKHYTDF